VKRELALNRRWSYATATTVGILVAIGTFTLFHHHRHHKQAVTVPARATNNQRQAISSGTLVDARINRGLPSQLVIPKLNVAAKVGYMGLTKSGDMETPSNVHDVGWYKYGAIPGNSGTAVVAGHLDGLKGEPGVFSSLDKLQKGDSFSVIDSKNQTIHFVVRETRTYRYDEQAAEVFNSTEGVHLNLITCIGAWDRSQRHFTQRLVVFADSDK
jgi:LPXTG-site transpeptidase (sortase) family protein